ncbi:MAG: NRDE family protein [Haloferacaceae archaeon]
MCTLTLAWQVFADAPIIAAANRDESIDRSSSPPTVHPSGVGDSGPGSGSGSEAGPGSRSGSKSESVPAALAPTDVRAGGTWIGLNDRGVFATVTNRWTDADLAGDRSRGLLVADCLAAQSALEAARDVERQVTEVEYDGFNLVIADASSAHLLEWDGRLRVRGFAPGVHVVVNVGADGAYSIPAARSELGESQAANADELRGRLQPEPGEAPDAWLDRAGAALADHDAGVCVHADGFGTRSTSLIRVSSDGDVRYDYADGPPCETPAEPVGCGFDVEPSRDDRGLH